MGGEELRRRGATKERSDVGRKRGSKRERREKLSEKLSEKREEGHEKEE